MDALSGFEIRTLRKSARHNSNKTLGTMAKKVFKKITVATLPNGYALNYDGQEFMYFNEVDLLAGFMARVGSGKTEDMEKGDILNALFDVMLGEKYARDITKLTTTVERLERKWSDRIEKVEREYARVKEKTEQHDKMKMVLEETTTLVNEMRMGYQEACKPWEEYKSRINDIEKDTQRIETHFKSATTQADGLLKLTEEKLEAATKTEKLLNSKARMLVERLAMRMENLPEGEPSGTVADEAEETPDDGVVDDGASNGKDNEEKSATKREKKPKADKPKKETKPKEEKPAESKPKGKTERQKRDEAILKDIEEKAMNNSNIK